MTMKAFLDCVACTLGQGLRAVRSATNDPEVHRRAILAMLAELAQTDLSLTPVELGDVAQRIVARETGVADPYREARARANAEALSLYPRLKEIVRSSAEPLLTAAKIAIVGNIIDLGAYGHEYDVEAALEQLLHRPFARDDFAKFREALRRARSVFYLADNAGEIVFDRVLLEEMPGRQLTVAVKSEPFINDAMLPDAEQVGLTEIARVIEVPIYPGRTNEFTAAWEEADLIVSKGHANFESYDEAEGPLFFLLLAKCDFVARSTGVEKGQMVLFAR
jgi:uncharacterized protein with ATP-grasp and redox domains